MTDDEMDISVYIAKLEAQLNEAIDERDRALAFTSCSCAQCRTERDLTAQLDEVMAERDRALEAGKMLLAQRDKALGAEETLRDLLADPKYIAVLHETQERKRARSERAVQDDNKMLLAQRDSARHECDSLRATLGDIFGELDVRTQERDKAMAECDSLVAQAIQRCSSR